MQPAKIFSLILKIAIIIAAALFLFKTYQYLSKAEPVKANIQINTKKITGPLPFNWKALAQGGEEKGVRMFKNVIPPLSLLAPRYIRIDHVYDFYDVVGRDSSNQLTFNWDKLDETVCDIFHTGAKPFFSLGYMPPALSSDGSLISAPANWDDWAQLVQKTIERYSSRSTRLCGQVAGNWFSDIFYEVWNEPDLETFGKWSIYGGNKDYRKLYYYSALGASKALDVNNYFLGGPATTRPYKNWLQAFLDYASDNNLRVDFLSWHHYSTQTNDFSDDVSGVNSWLYPRQYDRYKKLPLIISEWGFDSEPNPTADTNVGAAHTVASIRNMVEQKVEMAFAFEIKDGPAPRWGIHTYEGEKKPRYYALKILNSLDRSRLQVEGEGTYVKALASLSGQKIAVVLVNYDPDNRNIEMVPVSFNNLDPATYQLTQINLKDEITVTSITSTENQIERQILMTPNSVIGLELKRL